MTVIHAWVGAAGDDGARVRAKIEGGSGELFVSTASDMSGEVSAGTDSATSDGMVTLDAGGRDPDTVYYWQVEDADGTRSPTGRFRTHRTAGEPYSFTFAAFGDAGAQPDFPGQGDVLEPNRLSNHPGFDTVRRLDPLFLCHLGDLHYYNPGDVTGDTLADYRRTYDDVLAQPRQHELYRRMPVIYTWDDHDFGPNDSDGTHTGKGNAAAAFRERVPHYPLAESTGPIYHSWQVGRVLFIASDVRYDRDPNDDPQSSSKTMLGSAQKTWMDTLLASSGAEALIWQMPSQWMGSSIDSWDAFRHERDELVQMLGDHGWLDRMCIISADYHGLAIDTGTGNRWGGFPVFHFASIDALATPPPAANLGSSTGRNRYGLMRVVDDSNMVQVTGTGMIGTTVWRRHTWFSRPGAFTVPSILPLDYRQGHVNPPFEPTEDDQLLRNDVTAERDGGSSARAVQQSGPLSVDDVGRYDESVTINVAHDDSLHNQAGWRVHLGTVDEPRYPEVTVNLAANQHLIGQVTAVESGDRFTVTNTPDWLPPGDVELIAQGYEERLTPWEWEWTVNTSPAEPWTVGVVAHEVIGRADTSGSALGEDIDDADTVFAVQVTDGPTWITGADFPLEFPFDVEAGGEVMRVTDVDAESSGFQQFTVGRSVNGIVKSHDVGTSVSLAHPAFVAL